MFPSIEDTVTAAGSRLFVYGTLLRGLSRAQVLRGARFLGPALVEGRLFDLGRYPGLRPGRGLVVGELWEVDTATLERIDRIEGFDPRDRTGSLYQRVKTPVRSLSGTPFSAATYRYNRRPPGDARIGHGDYRRYLLEHRPGQQPMVAYGSNLRRSRIEERIGPVGRRRPGALPGFRLSLEKRAAGGPRVVANLRFTGRDGCPGALHRVEPRQLEAMDRFEGTPDHYLRVVLPFRPEGERGLRLAHTWIAHPDRVTTGLPVAPEYLAHLRAGYGEFGWTQGPIELAVADLPEGTDEG
ncbi:MAG: gamma-glutamylcyclotransferase [Thioalkalivibrio sp.]|nr:gamma-glutamylcyclotransferase [Thioalkalivibrio sp.]